jgi:hypothetical protein
VIYLTMQYQSKETLTVESLQNLTGKILDPSNTTAPLTATPTSASRVPMVEDPNCPGYYSATIPDAIAALCPDGGYTTRVRDGSGNLVSENLGSFYLAMGDDGSKGTPFVTLPYVNGSTIRLYGAMIEPAPTS